jgi:hypothetical protein
MLDASLLDLVADDALANFARHCEIDIATPPTCDRHLDKPSRAGEAEGGPRESREIGGGYWRSAAIPSTRLTVPPTSRSQLDRLEAVCSSVIVA